LLKFHKLFFLAKTNFENKIIIQHSNAKPEKVGPQYYLSELGYINLMVAIQLNYAFKWWWLNLITI
jgi:hypothetical protein